MKRLTMHLRNVETVSHRKGKGEFKLKIFNTITVPVKDEAEAESIVSKRTDVSKSYVSNIK